MFFASEREPPKAGRGSGGRGGAGGRAADIVEKARVERELREQNRIRSQYAVRIQARWRGRHSARRVISAFSANAQKKVSDIGNVSRMLKATKGIDFVPPVKIVVSLLRELLFLHKNKVRVVLALKVQPGR
jgi:hypothetical protein